MKERKQIEKERKKEIRKKERKTIPYKNAMQQMTIHFPLIKLYRSQFNLVEERKDKTQKYNFFNLLIKLKVITYKISSEYQHFFNLCM